MTKKVVYSDNAPEPIGPYSQAIEFDGTIYCSGQIAINAKTQEVFTGDIKKQTQLVMENISHVLGAAGLDFTSVVKTTIFLTSMSDFPSVNEVYGEFFKTNAPARSTVAVSGLPKGVNVEIEVLARR